jgi:Mrp family chromosome partitioning ATPase
MSAPGAPSPSLVPGIAHVIAISSGKGGVGKSTVTVNVAVALAARGLRVGVLDADITGRYPMMLFPVSRASGRCCDHARYGVRLMSIGFLVDPSGEYRAAVVSGAQPASTGGRWTTSWWTCRPARATRS